MKASICLITCGAHQLLERTLSALFEHTPTNHQIIILQNGFELDSPILRDVTLLYVDDRLGVAHARNHCLEHVLGDVCIWLDDDIECAPNYIDAFMKPVMEQEHVGLVGYDTLVTREQFGGQFYVDWQQTGFFDYFDSPYLVNMEMIKELGTYDRRTGPLGCDNTDLCLRAWEADWKLVPIQNPDMKHWRGSTSRNLFRLPKPTNPDMWITRPNLNKWFENNLEYMRSRHFAGWRGRYGVPHGILKIDYRLQNPGTTGRLGGPEDKAEWIDRYIDDDRFRFD